MTDKEIEEGNQLIAEFVEYEDFYNVKVMYYHEEWSWLMPVLFACENKGFDLNYRRGEVKTYYPDIKYYPVPILHSDDPLCSPIDDSKIILSVWLAIVEFIKWYNEHGATRNN